MEVLPPDPTSSTSALADRAECKPSTPVGAAAPPVSRARSGSHARRSSPHEVISLTSTTHRSHSHSHSAATGFAGTDGAAQVLTISHSPHAAAASPSSSHPSTPLGGGNGGLPLRPPPPASTLSASTTSLFNPVTEGEDSSTYLGGVRSGAAAGASTSGAGATRGLSALGRRAGAGAGVGVEEDEEQPPGTPASVASGRMGGTFMTGLRRSFGTPGFGDDDDLGLSSLSHANPMASPSASSLAGDDPDEAAFREYAGDEAGPGGALEGQGQGGAVGPHGLGADPSTAMTDYGNPMLTPELSAAAPAAGQSGADDPSLSRQSLLLVIKGLYVTEPQPPPSEAGSAPPSRPATAPGQAPPRAPQQQQQEEEEEEEGDGEDEDDAEALAASRAHVQALTASTAEQDKRRSELGQYMVRVQSLKDSEGAPLVSLPRDWAVELEAMMRRRRAEYRTLQGWLGPTRFEDLPINQLPEQHPDARVEEGLRRIRELDDQLHTKLIAAMISHRETFPEQWAEQERSRLERHTKAVEVALTKERQKRLRGARLSRAVSSLDDRPSSAASWAGSLSGASVAGSAAGAQQQQQSLFSRLLGLRPEDEELVERVLARSEEEEQRLNPFDVVDGNAAGAAGSGLGLADQSALLSELDAQLDALLPSSRAHQAAMQGLQGGGSSLLGNGEASADSLGGGDAPSTPGGGGGGGELGAEPSSSGSGGAGAGPPSRPGSALPSRPGTAGGVVARAALQRPTLGDPAAGGVGGLRYEDPAVAARALRVINARLASFEAEHVWDEQGSLADFKPLAAAAAPLAAVAAAAAGPGPGSVAGAGRPASPPGSVRGGGGGGAKSVRSGVSPSGMSLTEQGARDYLREERSAKELAERERELDASLRALKTGEVVKLGGEALKLLVEQCRRLQELNELRRKAEAEEAAAVAAAREKRLAEGQQQQQQAAAAAKAAARAAAGKGASGAASAATAKPPPAPKPAPGAAAGASSSSSSGTPTKAASAAAAPAAGTPKAGGGKSSSFDGAHPSPGAKASPAAAGAKAASSDGAHASPSAAGGNGKALPPAAARTKQPGASPGGAKADSGAGAGAGAGAGMGGSKLAAGAKAAAGAQPAS